MVSANDADIKSRVIDAINLFPLDNWEFGDTFITELSTFVMNPIGSDASTFVIVSMVFRNIWKSHTKLEVRTMKSL